jgi:rhodanese-related sulfurtransferase/uncharacterized membrane protein YphA (DoxX/SURF4 family)
MRDWKRLSFILLRLFLGAVFVYASYDKILRPSGFAEIIFNYQVLPEILINLASLILPWIELLLGFLLIFGYWLPGAVLLCNCLLLVFVATLIFNFTRGLDIDCGCFSLSSGTSSGGHMLWYLLRDSLFLLMGISIFASIFFGRGKQDAWVYSRMKRSLTARRERSAADQTWRMAFRQATSIVLVGITLGLISSQVRPNSLPWFGEWSPEARLTLKLGKKMLISFEEARDAFVSRAAVFLDARPADEYRKGHIQGARNLHIGEFDEKVGEVLIDLPENALIVTYCDGERCTLSAELAQKLKQIGFENVRVLFNGWTVWKQHHLPTQVEDARAS